MSCSKMEKLKFDVRMAEAAAEQKHSARTSFLESFSPSGDIDHHLVAVMEELIVEAEMKRTCMRMLLDHHAHNCILCSRANSN